MDEEIKKVFYKWWAGNPIKIHSRGNPDPTTIAETAFEQGWGEGIASIMDKAAAKVEKAGKGRITSEVGFDTYVVDGRYGPIKGIFERRKNANRKTTK